MTPKLADAPRFIAKPGDEPRRARQGGEEQLAHRGEEALSLGFPSGQSFVVETRAESVASAAQHYDRRLRVRRECTPQVLHGLQPEHVPLARVQVYKAEGQPTFDLQVTHGSNNLSAPLTLAEDNSGSRPGDEGIFKSILVTAAFERPARRT